jgi:ABC-type phosphate transport system substrate-binding protein
MKNRLTKGFLASALALSLALVACDTDNPDDGGSSTTAPTGTETTTTLAGSSTTSP